MGLLELLSGQTRQSPKDLLESEDWSEVRLFGGPTFTGIQVSAERAFTVSTVRACVQVLAEDIASLPFPVFRETSPGNREQQRSHAMWRLLNRAPNRLMTAYTWRVMIMVDLLAWGNHYAMIDRNPRNLSEIRGFMRFDPWQVDVAREGQDLFYRVKLPTGEWSPTIPAEMMLHVSGLGFDGIMGKSVIGHARQAVGLALAAEEYGARWFGQGSRPTGVFSHPGKLSPEAKDNLTDSLREAFSGLNKSHGIIVTEEGTKWQNIGLPPDDSQFIQTRDFQATDIARFFKVPGHMVGIQSNQPRANVEQESIDYVSHTIRPHCVRIEQEINRKAFIIDRDADLSAEHNVDGLLRGDLKSRYEAYAIGRNGGWLSANDVRRRENMNPIEGGDSYMVPMNMVPADQFEELAAANEGVEATVRLTFRDASLRVVRKERKALKLHEKKLDGAALESWRTKFYDDHRGAIRAAFEPIVFGVVSNISQRMRIESTLSVIVKDAMLDGLMGLRDSGEDPTTDAMDAALRSMINGVVRALAEARGWKTTTHRGWDVEWNGVQKYARQINDQSGSPPTPLLATG